MALPSFQDCETSVVSQFAPPFLLSPESSRQCVSHQYCFRHVILTLFLSDISWSWIAAITRNTGSTFVSENPSKRDTHCIYSIVEFKFSSAKCTRRLQSTKNLVELYQLKLLVVLSQLLHCWCYWSVWFNKEVAKENSKQYPFFLSNKQDNLFQLNTKFQNF